VWAGTKPPPREVVGELTMLGPNLRIQAELDPRFREVDWAAGGHGIAHQRALASAQPGSTGYPKRGSRVLAALDLRPGGPIC